MTMPNPAPSSNLDVNNRTLNLQNIAVGTARPINDHCLQNTTEGTARPPNDNSLHDRPPVVQASTNQQNADKKSSTISREKFASIIIDVDNRLPSSKLRDIKFLCHDKVSDRHVLEDAKSVKDIFKDMSDFGTLKEGNVGMIAELMHRVGLVKAKNDAFRGTGIMWPIEGDTGMTYLDEFRCLLHYITQQISTKKLETAKGFCSLQVSSDEDIGHDLDEVSDFLGLFMLLEDQELIASDNIGLLQDLSESVFKNQKVRDQLRKYEEHKLQEGPVLSVTEKEAEKLVRWRMVANDGGGQGKLSPGYYGAIQYEKMIAVGAKKKKKEAEESAPAHKGIILPLVSPLSSTGGEVTGGGLPSFSKIQAKGLVTPSMLQGSSSYGSMKADGPNNLPRAQDNQQQPVDDHPTPLQSMEPMDTDDEEEYLTIPHEDIHRSLQMPYYKMDAKPRGICLIFSNKTFPNHPEITEREGTEKDVENLLRMFRFFDFEVHIKPDMTRKEMKDELKYWQNHSHDNYNAFVCCVLSHGNRGYVLARDGKEVQLSDIVGYFKGNSCPSLIGKPKIFIIQACQGDDWQRLTSDRTPRSPTGRGVGIGTGYETLPQEVDILLLLSTVPGYKSVRTKVKGSWFIMALTQIWRKFPDAEIQSVVTLLNHELSKVTNARERERLVAQTAFPSYTLRKLLFFRRPVNQ